MIEKDGVIKEGQLDWDVRTQFAIADFEDGGRKQKAKVCGQPVETRKDKEMDSVLEPEEISAALLTPWL